MKEFEARVNGGSGGGSSPAAARAAAGEPSATVGSVGSGARVTLRMLADHLGLSPASISLVLNQAPAAEAIPKPTQDRILAAARRFNYRPNTLAKSLRRQRSFTIGVMVPEISDGYASMVMSGIEDQLLQEGYLYFVASHRHKPDLIDEYPKLLLSRAVDGLIAVDTPCDRPLPVPVVAVSGHRHTEGVTNIVLNHERAAFVALEHLAALGHRRIAFIKGQALQLGHRGPLARHPRGRAAHRPADRRRARHATRRRRSVARSRVSHARAGCSKADASSRRCSPSTTSRRSARSARCAKRAAACPRTSRWSASTTSRAPNSRIRA